MVYLTTSTIQNQPKVGKYTSPMDHMGFRLFLHANDLGEIFLQFITFLPFRADSVQVPTKSVRPETSPSELKGFTNPSHPIPSPTTNRWKETPPFPHLFHESPTKPWKTSLVSSNITSRGKVSVAKNDFLETPDPWEGIPWEWRNLTAWFNHKKSSKCIGKYTIHGWFWAMKFHDKTCTQTFKWHRGRRGYTQNTLTNFWLGCQPIKGPNPKKNSLATKRQLRGINPHFASMWSTLYLIFWGWGCQQPMDPGHEETLPYGQNT